MTFDREAPKKPRAATDPKWMADHFGPKLGVDASHCLISGADCESCPAVKDYGLDPKPTCPIAAYIAELLDRGHLESILRADALARLNPFYKPSAKTAVVDVRLWKHVLGGTPTRFAGYGVTHNYV